eukprot:4418426-Amphidinium_carterae.1
MPWPSCWSLDALPGVPTRIGAQNSGALVALTPRRGTEFRAFVGNLHQGNDHAGASVSSACA